ncbi:unnamed protein product [Brassica oleracea var. botrytis]
MLRRLSLPWLWFSVLLLFLSSPRPSTCLRPWSLSCSRALDLPGE